MHQHNIYYYPYASFKEKQAPLLKAAALYFDTLYILDPVKASWDRIGATEFTRDLKLLEDEGILVRISPEDVLNQYEAAIEGAIRADLGEPEFVKLCDQFDTKGRWTLALAKVPANIRDDPQFRPLDQSMRQMMGDFARTVSTEAEATRYNEVYIDYAATGQVFDEVGMVGEKLIEYRYADYPLALGEAIMMNHALFGSLLHTGATPLTDDSFHNKVLDWKIQRARHIPAVREILEDRAQQRQLKRDQLAMTALTDLDLAIISPEMPLEEILKYRYDHKDTLQQARQELGWLAREIRQTPWNQDFTDELDVSTIPKIRDMLKESKKARNSWLKSERGKNALKAAGLAMGAAAATISLVLSPTPLLPVAVVTGVLGLVSSTVIPGVELALDWKQGRQKAMENGLHYFLDIKS